MYRMGLIDNDLCWKCKKERGTFVHSTWECAFLRPLWEGILNMLEKWIGKIIPVCPQLCLLGNRETVTNLTKCEFRIVTTGLVSAARIILRHWKSSEIPDLKEWVDLLIETASYERILTRISDQYGKDSKVWGKFMV